MHVLAVERRDERGVHERDDLVGKVVAFVLQVADPLRVTFGVGKVADQDREVHHATEHASGGAVEQVEERELTGDDLERHATPSLPSPWRSEGTGRRGRCPPGERQVNALVSPRTCSRAREP